MTDSSVEAAVCGVRITLSMGNALGPSTLVPVPTPPDQLEFAEWDHAGEFQ